MVSEASLFSAVSLSVISKSHAEKTRQPNGYWSPCPEAFTIRCSWVILRTNEAFKTEPSIQKYCFVRGNKLVLESNCFGQSKLTQRITRANHEENGQNCITLWLGEKGITPFTRALFDFRSCIIFLVCRCGGGGGGWWEQRGPLYFLLTKDF